MFKRTETIKFSDFMSGEYNKPKEKKERKTVNKMALASASIIPVLAFTPKVLAASCTTAAVTVSTTPAAVPVGVTAAVSKELIAGLAHLFDPLISLLVGVSFPIASTLILFKLFMGFFQDQGQVWEGIGRIAIVYVLIQMFPIFSSILKQLGTLV